MTSALDLLSSVKTDFRSLARILTYVENDLPMAAMLLRSLQPDLNIPVIGVTGPPGAGKSTLINALIDHLAAGGNKVAVLAVDPTSPFNFGSLLGDRIRMAEQFTRNNVFIRSLATRGSLGGLSVKTIEMVDVLRAAGFDQVIVETVGVGQSEVEIAGLADVTIVVLVPGAGDEVQNMKSGVMEIADVFVVNKADRDGADAAVANLERMVHMKSLDVPVFKAVANRKEGIAPLAAYLTSPHPHADTRKLALATEKAWKLIAARRMQSIDKQQLRRALHEAMQLPDFNLYRFAAQYG
ncbi:methylmalonyl Co-A mutase-associated GTPase MeaB [Hufsiella ginkgonis]|uniref:Methylmalonyl Co-A mutase-associated GTPase MeaB n=1 Tax=Hufsiella ginkgonis TaxID=2695274 RepID=A0A7K1XSR2_9SPHI|nr:methylmalonyl Co-A mutase-associated GTPase MeaB [Hufsiella ginkgonis]MXV13950.1 methylmalonyl Co-A mutase-associated GTPase MeaB [Hufsiella ginkgonis]